MPLPKIEELRSKKFVLLLGAGSSMDYDFPNWNQLRTDLEMRLRESCETETNDTKLCNYWLEVLESHRGILESNKKTIDHVISENYNNLVERHFIVQFIEQILAGYEAFDASKGEQPEQWISVFKDKFIALLRHYIELKDDQAVLDILANFNVISLNYERCFAKHFFPAVYDIFSIARLQNKDFLHTHSKELIDFFKVYQPHGSLGYLWVDPMQKKIGNPVKLYRSINGTKYTKYVTRNSGRAYGKISTADDRLIELVGEGDLTYNYDAINQRVIKGADICIAIGLSPTGIRGCEINWGSFERIFYSGSSIPIDGVGTWECLSMKALPIARSIDIW